jgi:prefoldin subunit 5
MSDAKAEEIMTITNDGVTVEKSFEPDDFPVPAIAFTLQSNRDETVSVRLVDSVPEEVSPENVGFHPKYGAEFWDVDGDSIVFERELAPEEGYTTVYGLRGSDADEADKFMSEPTIESVDPPLEASGQEPDEAASSEEQADSVDDLDIGPDAGGHEEIDTPSDVGSEPLEDEPVSSERGVDTDTTVTLDGEDDSIQVGHDTPDEPNDSAGEPAPKADAAPGIDIDDNESEADNAPIEKNGSAEPTGTDSLLDSLADEIEAADPDDPELAAIRDALGMNLTPKSTEARIEHLQSTVADLDAYTDALEEFLDHNGDAQSLLADLQSDYEATMDRLDDIETKTESNDEAIVDLDAELESKLETRLADVENEISGLETRLESIEDDLSEVVKMRNRLANALGGLGAAPENEPSDTDAE